MTFKDALREDLDVFINVEEFGEMVELDEVKLMAVLVKNSSAPQSPSISARNHIHSELHNQPLVGEFVTLYYKAADLGRVPKYGEFIRLNGVRYKVQNSAESFGLVKLELSTERAPAQSAARLPNFFGD